MGEPTRLPFEDLDADLYLHQPDRDDLLEQRSGLDGGTRFYLPVEKFMEIQRQRDQYRRAISLINGWRLRSRRDERTLVRLLEGVGLTDRDGDAINQIVRQFTEQAEGKGSK
jgi:hypothetical protein